MNPITFTRSVRSLNRIRQIAQVLTLHGFGHIVAQIDLTRFLPVWMLRKKKVSPSEEGGSAIGQRLATVCSELGPTFIKLGQWLSTRPDMVPGDVLNELRKLQDEVPPFDTSQAMDIIVQELGKPVEQCFESIDTTPFASASIGQVYRAKTHKGQHVIVKVRRPDIRETIELDMQLLRWLAESMEEFIPELNIYRPTTLVSELDEMLTRELDYINEASTTCHFVDAFKNDPDLRIPTVLWEFTGSRVLTLEMIPGTNLDKYIKKLEKKEVPGDTAINKPLVARRLANCYLKQIFDLGLFHADPHPGNILIDPPARVGLIDFGQVGTLSDDLMTEMIIFVYACLNNEMNLAVDALADMDALGSDTDRRSLQRALMVLRDKYYGLPMKRFDMATLFNEYANVMRRHDVVIPKDMSMLIKALSTVGLVTAKLDPELDLLTLVKPKLQQAMRERISPAHMTRRAGLLSWDVFSILRRAPRQVRDALRRVATHGLELHIKHENIDRLVRELDRSSNRLAFSIVIAAIIVGSSVVISAGSELNFFGVKVQYLGIIGYLFAGILGLGLSWAIFRSGRLH